MKKKPHNFSFVFNVDQISIFVFVAFNRVEQLGSRYLLVDVKGSDSGIINSVGKKNICEKL